MFGFQSTFAKNQSRKPNINPLIVQSFPQNRYSIEKRIGEGSYGRVDLAKDLSNNQLVAFKTMKDTGNDSVPHSLLRELEILR